MRGTEVRCDSGTFAGSQEQARPRREFRNRLPGGIATVLAGLLVGLCVSACSKAPDMAPVKAIQARAVHATDNFMAVAVAHDRYGAGGGNVLLRSADGKTWVRQELPRASAIIAMAACPNSALAALDFRSKVWVLDAGAKSWEARSLTDKLQPMDLTCAADGRLWAVGGDSTIEYSADLGKSWTITHQGDDAYMRSVRFVDAQHGFVAGEFGTFLVTEDGGQTWMKRQGLPETFYPFSMAFLNSQTGWISGPAGANYYTADAGLTWTEQQSPTGSPLFALFQQGGEVFGAGDAGRLLQASATGWTRVTNFPGQQVPLTDAVPVAGGWLMSGPAGFVSVVKSSASTAPATDGARS